MNRLLQGSKTGSLPAFLGISLRGYNFVRNRWLVMRRYAEEVVRTGRETNMNASWRAATMDTIFDEARPPLLQRHCWLRLSAGTLELSFEIGSSPTMIGKRDGTGHYRVVVPGSGDGTLHRFADDEMIEGSWNISGKRGFWRVAFDASGVAEARVVPIRRRPARRRSSVRAARPVRMRPRRAV